MTIEEVRERIESIEKIGWGDPESAHGNEDDLMRSVLRAIAEGTAEDAVEMARMAASTEDISFPRWCA